MAIKKFTLSKEDWDKLMELSKEARSTPVIALSVADGLAGRDFASRAHDNVYDYWYEMGLKYGFNSHTIKPLSEENRTIMAEKTVKIKKEI